jgi:hypothetical protein
MIGPQATNTEQHVLKKFMFKCGHILIWPTDNQFSTLMELGKTADFSTLPIVETDAHCVYLYCPDCPSYDPTVKKL